MAGEQLEPITRKEYFLAKAAGMDVETPEPITREEMFLSMISGGGTGGSGGGGSIPSVSPKAVNFYDYDGTCLYAYTVEEAQALTEMPPLPEREGLICQGWNWTLEDVKAHNRAVNVGATYITDDGTTRIYITLIEGLTSPELRFGINGTAEIDWGDNSELQTISGTSTSSASPIPHDYSKPGDYVIRIKANGEIGFIASSSSGSLLLYRSGDASLGKKYRNTIRKIEIGSGVTDISNFSFNYVSNLDSITIPNGVTKVGDTVFQYCYSLTSITIPNSVINMGTSVFSKCANLKSITIPNSVINMGDNFFMYCYSLNSITIPNSVNSISTNMFYECYSLKSITIPNSVENVGSYAFIHCYYIDVIDYTHCTAIPTLKNTNAFSSIMPDCEIRVPAALYNEWIAAENWSTYASQIVAV